MLITRAVAPTRYPLTLKGNFLPVGPPSIQVPHTHLRRKLSTQRKLYTGTGSSALCLAQVSARYAYIARLVRPLMG